MLKYWKIYYTLNVEYLLHLSPANWVATKNVRTQENNLSVQKHGMVQFIARCRLQSSNRLWSTFLGQYHLKYREVSVTTKKIFHLSPLFFLLKKERRKYFCSRRVGCEGDAKFFMGQEKQDSDSYCRFAGNRLNIYDSECNYKFSCNTIKFNPLLQINRSVVVNRPFPHSSNRACAYILRILKSKQGNIKREALTAHASELRFWLTDKPLRCIGTNVLFFCFFFFFSNHVHRGFVQFLCIYIHIYI